MLYNFSKGDLLMLHVNENETTILLVVHVVERETIFYCWDRQEKVYRLVHTQPGLFLLSPGFDPEFPSDIDWELKMQHGSWLDNAYVNTSQNDADENDTDEIVPPTKK